MHCANSLIIFLGVCLQLTRTQTSSQLFNWGQLLFKITEKLQYACIDTQVAVSIGNQRGVFSFWAATPAVFVYLGRSAHRPQWIEKVAFFSSSCCDLISVSAIQSEARVQWAGRHKNIVQRATVRPAWVMTLAVQRAACLVRMNKTPPNSRSDQTLTSCIHTASWQSHWKDDTSALWRFFSLLSCESAHAAKGFLL